MFSSKRILSRVTRSSPNYTFGAVIEQLSRQTSCSILPSSPTSNSSRPEKKLEQEEQLPVFIPEVVQVSREPLQRSFTHINEVFVDEEAISQDVSKSIMEGLEGQDIWKNRACPALESISDESLTPAQRFYVENRDLLLKRAVAYSVDQARTDFEKATEEIEDEWKFYRDPVVRPEKGSLWSASGDPLHSEFAEEVKFEKGRFPSIDEICHFLSLEKIQAILPVDLELCGRRDIGEWAIIGTAQSSTHARRVGNRLRSMINELDLLQIKCFINAGIPGQEWVVTRLGSVVLHLMTSADRQNYKLEDIYTTPVLDSIQDGIPQFSNELETIASISSK
jgi:ribosomal silencing factor RsfS